jgi:hypothetical protein
LVLDESAGRFARELWWTSQEFSSVNIIPPRLSMLMYHLALCFKRGTQSLCHEKAVSPERELLMWWTKITKVIVKFSPTFFYAHTRWSVDLFWNKEKFLRHLAEETALCNYLCMKFMWQAMNVLYWCRLILVWHQQTQLSLRNVYLLSRHKT